jgi:glycerol-3-phosphate acyltransferase PlsY
VAITLTLIWLVVVYFTRYVSLGSLMAGVSLPLVMLLFGMERVYVIGGVIMAIMATVRHRSNIQRLVGGSELKIGQRK